MKRIYEAPVAEKIRFQYAEQVAASTQSPESENPNTNTESDTPIGDAVGRFLEGLGADWCKTLGDLIPFSVR